jgi:hypothetical protein
MPRNVRAETIRTRPRAEYRICPHERVHKICRVKMFIFLSKIAFEKKLLSESTVALH